MGYSLRHSQQRQVAGCLVATIVCFAPWVSTRHDSHSAGQLEEVGVGQVGALGLDGLHQRQGIDQAGVAAVVDLRLEADAAGGAARLGEGLSHILHAWRS